MIVKSIYPTHEYLAETDSDFLEFYNQLAGKALLHEGNDSDDVSLPAKYRELIVCGILAFKGSSKGLVTHIKRALNHGATEREVLEAFEASVVPGGAPTFLNGVNGLMQALGKLTESKE